MDFLLFLQEHQYPLLVTIFEAISLLMDKTIIIALVAYLYWLYDKKIAHKIAVGYFLSGLAVQCMKITFRIHRPWVLDERIRPSEEMLETATGYSFPSGHTQTATSLCYSLLDIIKKNWLRVILFVFPFLMMFSRMYVLVHSPLDVSVSFIVTAIIVVLAMKYLNKDYEKNLKNVAIVLLVGSALGLIYTCYVVSADIVTYTLAADSIKMMGAIMGYAVGCLLEIKYLNFEMQSTNIVEKIVIMVIGILGMLVMKSGLNLILPDHMLVDFLRYFLTIFWTIYIYPVIFTRFKKA